MRSGHDEPVASGGLGPVQGDPELLATEARQHVDAAHGSDEAAGGRAQQGVAGVCRSASTCWLRRAERQCAPTSSSSSASTGGAGSRGLRSRAPAVSGPEASFIRALSVGPDGGLATRSRRSGD